MTEGTLARLEDQYRYYDKTASRSQRNFRAVKILQLIVAASVTVAAAAGAGAVVTALIGATILVLEGVQALFGWQQNWVNYRNTAEALKTEQSLFEATAGPYARASNPGRLLAERVEALLSTERSGWVAAQLPPGAAPEDHRAAEPREPEVTPAAEPIEEELPVASDGATTV
jgi:Protein of unknown function (DUF4231)